MTLISKNFSEVITFSRGTGATRVNSAGLIVGVDFSTTSNTIATGSKTFTLAADANVNRDWPVGSNVIAVAQAGATGSMTGTVTSYTPSTQSLVINVVSVTGSGTSTNWRIGSLEMREDYDPVTLVRKGVLSEVAASNRFLQSINGSISPWADAAGQTATRSQVASGLLDSLGLTQVVATSVNGGIRQSLTGLISGSAYTWTFFIKSASTAVTLEFENGASGFGAAHIASLSAVTGVVVVNAGFVRASSIPYADGFIVSLTTLPAGGGLIANPEIKLSAVSETMLVGRFQFEASTSATSYIPTTTAQVTRNADSFPLTSAAVASIRQGESTLYAEIDCPDTGVAQKRALRLSGVNADIRIGKQGTGTLSNFTKMAEGAGLRLMGTANSLIRGNGQDLVGVTAVNDRTGVAAAVPSVNAAAFDGVNRFGLASSSTGGGATEEVFIDGALGTVSGKGTGGVDFSGSHYNGSRFIAVSQGNTGVVFVSDGTSYRRINTPVINQIAFEVTSGLVGGTLRNVLVGNAGFIATSDDNGETWTARTSGTATRINAVTRSTTHFVAAIDVTNATLNIRRSTDGETWVAVANSNFVQIPADVHANGATVVAVGGNGAVSVSADNGTTWTAATATNTTQLLNGVTYSPTLNLWVAVGNAGTIITATDPTGTWTVQTSGTTQTLTEVGIFNNAIYVVGGGSTLLTSTNGTSYTSLSANASSTLRGIAASPTTVLISGSNGTLSSSTNGTTFTSRTNVNSTINGMAFGNGVFVSVGDVANGSGSGYIATIAADGTVTRRVSGTGNALIDLIFNNGRFICVGLSSTIIYSDNSGASWQTAALTGINFSSIAASNNTLVAVGGGGLYSISTNNGTTWAASAAVGVTSQNLRGIAFANGIYVAVGDAGTIIATTNGTTYTLRTSGTTTNLNSVMFSTRDNLWYAAGNGGVLLYSPDAGTWTAVQNSGTASILGTTLQSNQPLPQFKSGVNKIALSYKQNQVIAALNGVASTTDTTATIPSITAGTIGENFNGTIQKIEVLDSALTTSEIIEKTL